jgi:integrase/recombinase XerD
MFQTETRNHRTLEFALGGNLGISIESFLIDRKAEGLTRSSIEFYTIRLRQFLTYCDSQAVKLIDEISPDFLRRYILIYSESHNPGGVHASYRTLRAFFNWLEFEEVLPPDWRNPIKKVKAPRVDLPPLDPISLEDVSLLLACSDERDKAVFLFLLDTGVRANELCSINLEDMNLGDGSVVVRKGKGRKPRVVFIGRKTRRAIRAYFRTRHDNSAALFATKDGDRLNYMGLREILRRRSRDAGIIGATLHGFRRAFALGMLRNGADVFALQRLMGHSDLSVLRRYLAQTDDDTRLAHEKGSPVDSLW